MPMPVRLVDDPDLLMYHIEISKNMLDGCHTAIIPGAPERAELIAQSLEKPKKIGSHRGLDSWLGYLGKHPILVTNTGMGGPTLEIVVQELIRLGIDTFLRVGTCGAIQPEINVGSLIITEGAVRLDGTSDHYAPACFPAVADFDLTQALRNASDKTDRQVFHGITASSATFFPGQERYDSAVGYVHRAFQGSVKEWQSLGVLNFEMEAGALFTICRTMGLRAGCICAAIANRTQSEQVHRDEIRKAEEAATGVALAALKDLLG